MEPYRPLKLGTPFAEMSPARKLRFIGMVAVCIATFGFAFPNVMFD
jgi:hypothetical protein